MSVSSAEKSRVLHPGIEPGSSACEALVLTDIRTKLCMLSQEKCLNKYRLTYMFGSQLHILVEHSNAASAYVILLSLKCVTNERN